MKEVRQIEEAQIGKFFCRFLIDIKDGTRVAVIETAQRVDRFDPRNEWDVEYLQNYGEWECPIVPVHLLASWWIQDAILPSELEPAHVAELLLGTEGEEEGVRLILDAFPGLVSKALCVILERFGELQDEAKTFRFWEAEEEAEREAEG